MYHTVIYDNIIQDYEFGDISKEVENRRVDWMKSVLGEEAASNYEFGDLSKKALTSFTGKDEYEFGDVSKKIFGSMFGKRKRGGQQTALHLHFKKVGIL